MTCSPVVTDIISYGQNSLQTLMLSLSHLAGENRLAWEFLRDTFTKKKGLLINKLIYGEYIYKPESCTNK